MPMPPVGRTELTRLFKVALGCSCPCGSWACPAHAFAAAIRTFSAGQLHHPCRPAILCCRRSRSPRSSPPAAGGRGWRSTIMDLARSFKGRRIGRQQADRGLRRRRRRIHPGRTPASSVACQPVGKNVGEHDVVVLLLFAIAGQYQAIDVGERATRRYSAWPPL